ncbi:MAG: HAMP domain-containing sensor histidine kinase [Pyrinomonadaceae bacterium]
MTFRLNLLSKILLWVFLNLLVLGVVLYFIFNLQMSPDLPLLGRTDDRIEYIARLIAMESNEKTRAERDRILADYAERYNVEFYLFSNRGAQLGGKKIDLPFQIEEFLKRPPPPREDLRPRFPGGEPPGEFGERRFSRPPPVFVAHMETTSNPTRYWAVTRVPLSDGPENDTIPASVIAVSDSITGNSLFFNPRPWIALIGVVLGLSFVIWFPFVRNLNRSVRKLNKATEQIAEEDFAVRVDEDRTDEIGQLGKNVNQLAERLAGFVNGQKRFLGDISHELNSPLARMNWALSILEERVGDENQVYIEDVREEVKLMSELVAELLAYAKAGIRGSSVSFVELNLKQIVAEVVAREKSGRASIKIDVGEKLRVFGNRELLSRALSNVVRNSIRYAGDEPLIEISAREADGEIRLSVADNGKGVPEAELGRLFDPFHRLEKDRARKTGGSGLGLAIVKTCIESCSGSVSARNRSEGGLEIVFKLKSSNF